MVSIRIQSGLPMGCNGCRLQHGSWQCQLVMVAMRIQSVLSVDATADDGSMAVGNNSCDS